MIDFFDMLDFVEREIEVCKVRKVFEAADMCDEVVVEVQIMQGGGQNGQAFDLGDSVLAQAKACYGFEAIEAEGWDGGDARVDAVYFFGVGFVVVKEIWVGSD